MIQKRYIRWILAVLITLSAAVYQRMTGPTYPLRTQTELQGSDFKYKLPRSHGGETDLMIEIGVPDSTYSGYLYYRRYKTDVQYMKLAMSFNDDTLLASLPNQPPAGKLEYFIELDKAEQIVTIPAKNTVVVRFKGAVPATVLLPHILFMFIAMLVSSMAGLEALVGGEKTLRYVWITSITLFLGGMILGPIVQKFAFGAFWTGVPFGWDLTDNKTLVAMIGWLVALFRVSRGSVLRNRWWVVAAAIILLMIYSIPHSTMGSELDYSKMEVVTG